MSALRALPHFTSPTRTGLLLTVTRTSISLSEVLMSSFLPPTTSTSKSAMNDSMPDLSTFSAVGLMPSKGTLPSEMV